MHFGKAYKFPFSIDPLIVKMIVMVFLFHEQNKERVEQYCVFSLDAMKTTLIIYITKG